MTTPFLLFRKSYHQSVPYYFLQFYISGYFFDVFLKIFILQFWTNTSFLKTFWCIFLSSLFFPVLVIELFLIPISYLNASS